MSKEKKKSGQVDNLAAEIEKAVRAQLLKQYSPRVLELSRRPRNMGALDSADGFGAIRGVCGDAMQFFLRIGRGRVRKVKYLTDGCGPTIACGEAVAEMAAGKAVEDVLGISPGKLLENLGGLPESHLHCAILAVNTLHGAVADYLCKKINPQAAE